MNGLQKKYINRLRKLGACSKALDWCHTQPNSAIAWRECRNGEWMLWLLGKLSGPPESDSHRKLVLCACQCARLSLEYVIQGEGRPLEAIQMAERWARKNNRVTLEMVSSAAAAAYAAAYAAYASAAYAAYAAADAAYAAYASAAAASAAAAYAADAADAAYAASADDGIRANTQAKCADIVRMFYPRPPRIRKERP